MSFFLRLLAGIVLVPLLALLFFLPVVGVVCYWWFRHQLRAAANQCVCSCGTRLGVAAVRLADAEWAVEAEKLHRDARERGIDIRIIRHTDAICPACGARFHYRPHERRLVQGGRS